MDKIITEIYQPILARITKHRFIVVSLILLIQAGLANYLAFTIRFETMLPSVHVNQFITYLTLLLLIRLSLFLLAGLYKGLWRYASISDLIKIIQTGTIGSIIFFITVRYAVADINYPRSVYILDWLLFLVISGGSRLIIRVVKEHVFFESQRKRMLIIGAGNAGEMIVREMKSNRKCLYEPIGFIDDTQKKGVTIHGVPILGKTERMCEIIKNCKPDEIMVSSNDTQRSIREIYEMCKPFNIPIKKLPGINDLLDNNVFLGAKIGRRLVNAGLVTETQIQEALTLQKNEGGRLGSKLVKLGYITNEKLNSFLIKQLGISHMKSISLEDLLQREPVNSSISAIRDFLAHKCVMVTGAGGSIGSELCRQIIKYNPSHLLLLDRYENTLYEVDLELRRQESETKIETIVGDIQDSTFLEHSFSERQPQIIFHAAAYKHVPLMEGNPIEAVKNNIFGTKNLLEAASRFGSESFVLISTDKAVNPTSIMGATKRVAEFLTINMDAVSKGKFTAVRFGNVLGSNGSVIGIFKEQLTKGGPLTITHPEIKRFFMLTKEAVHLVLIAAAAGQGGAIYVLDMGEPIKITDLAENFIRLSGFTPHKEIKIRFTGMRPGEKLYEELFDESEQIVPTFHEKLMMAVPQLPSAEFLAHHILELEQVVRNYSVDEVSSIMRKILPNSLKHRTEFKL
jgi:FlaA1/EpsC-like NDP-sugar epimerase